MPSDEKAIDSPGTSEFGEIETRHGDLVLTCKAIAPGLTLHDLVMIFERATKEPGLNNLSANPSKWPTVHGVSAVVDAVVAAMLAASPSPPSDEKAIGQMTRLDDLNPAELRELADRLDQHDHLLSVRSAPGPDDDMIQEPVTADQHNAIVFALRSLAASPSPPAAEWPGEEVLSEIRLAATVKCLTALGYENALAKVREIVDTASALPPSGWNEGIEAAAKVADQWIGTWQDINPQYVSAQKWAVDAMEDIAENIRALKRDALSTPLRDRSRENNGQPE